MKIAALQIAIGFINLILIVRYSGNSYESDFYILSNTVVGFIVAIIYSYMSARWIAQLRKRINSKKIYIRAQKIYRTEVFITSVAAFLIGFFILYFIFLSISGYSNKINLLSIGIPSMIILFSTFINSAIIEKKAEGSVESAEYPMLIMQISLFILIIIMKPSKAIHVMLFSLIAHVVSLLIFFNLKNYIYINRVNRQLIKNIIINSAKFAKISLSATIFKSSPLVDRYLASNLQNGDVTALGVASAILSGTTILYEKGVGFKKVLGTIDAIKNKESYQLIDRLATYICVTFFLAAALLTVELTTEALSQCIRYIFSLNLQNSRTTIYLMIILMLALPFQFYGPLVSAVHQYHRREHFPMYIGALGFGIGAVLKYYISKEFSILAIPIISLMVISTLFFINVNKARKLNA